MERTKSALADHFYECAMSVIADENYDIVTDGGFLDSDFAQAATDIYKNLLNKGIAGGWVPKRDSLNIYTMGLQWKVNNYPGMVSCSNDEGTGVSRSESCIFGRVYGIDDDDAKELLDMMNEAWFLLTHNA